jgi:hypothetical protein
MPGELSPAQRLIQAVAYPGHAVLLKDGHVVLSSGDADVVATLAGVGRSGVSTVTLDGGLVACAQSPRSHVLVVGVPARLDTTTVHARITSALALFAGPAAHGPWNGGGSAGGGSGAPAELGLPVPRSRPN